MLSLYTALVPGHVAAAPSASRAAAGAQEPPPAVSGQPPSIQDGWNGAQVLRLAERAREARQTLVTDGGLENYRALTEGHIYFFVDPEEGERSLIRVDQVAVELRWQAPDVIQQHLLGERSETRLPVREFRYYLDRLTLVQYGFGDEIQVGSGMDVAGVPHPFAPLPPGGLDDAPYDFRIADSLTIGLSGESEPIRLYEVEVRPRDPARAGIVGRIVIDQRSASIVRMHFTFTPASYVDRRTDQISVEVDYGLWENLYWLPNLQRIEVRREIPELDLAVGTVIRAVLRTSEYELNVPDFPDLRSLPPITQSPPSARAGYDFPETLFESLERDGLADVALDADPRELRARAVELMRSRPPSGLSPLRFHLPRISSGLRFNRIEGAFVGMGASLALRGDLRARVHGGYAFGQETGRGSIHLEGGREVGSSWSLSASVGELVDLGARPGIDPLLSSLSALSRGEDYLDPWRWSGVRGALESRPFPGRSVRVEAEVGSHRSAVRAVGAAPLDDSRAFRSVPEITPGDFGSGRVVFQDVTRWPAAGRGSVRLSVGGVISEAEVGAELEGEAAGRWGPASGTRELAALLLARGWIGDPLPQAHRLVGGRNTLPGFPYRSFAGQTLVLGSVEAARDLRGAAVRGRSGLHAGWTSGLDAEVGEAWGVRGTDGPRFSVTLGIGLFWDLLRLDLARGLNGGEWQLLLSLDPQWWGRL